MFCKPIGKVAGCGKYCVFFWESLASAAFARDFSIFAVEKSVDNVENLCLLRCKKCEVSTDYVNLRSGRTRFARVGNILDRGGGAVGACVCVLGGADGAGCGGFGAAEAVVVAVGKKRTVLRIRTACFAYALGGLFFQMWR